jgi:hypothetical protein
MPHETPTQHPPTPLLKTLDHSIKVYSVAAIAAGVGVLALAQPAASEVVVTKKTITIPISEDGDGPTVKISLTNNGVNDFSFSLYSFNYHGIDRDLRIRPLEGGAVAAHSSKSHIPSALALVHGAKIGPSAHFSNNQNAFVEQSLVELGYTRSGRSYYTKNFAGDWAGNLKNRYLGVRFLINGKTHYGWVRLTLTTAPRKAMTATITAYAYETVANKRIQAGTTDDSATSVPTTQGLSARASLGMLALGADGMAIWRRNSTAN